MTLTPEQYIVRIEQEVIEAYEDWDFLRRCFGLTEGFDIDIERANLVNNTLRELLNLPFVEWTHYALCFARHFGKLMFSFESDLLGYADDDPS